MLVVEVMIAGPDARCATQAVEPTTGSILAIVGCAPLEKSEADDDDVEAVETDAAAGYLERVTCSGA